MVKLLITSNKGTVDITQLVQTITWAGDYQQCARTLSFDVTASPTDKNVPFITCDLGNAVTLMQNNSVLFMGYIFDRQKGTEGSTINITCYDGGIYLKRNETSKKYKGITPEAITKALCKEFGIKTGSIAGTGIKISRNFIGVNLYNIIQTAYTLASAETGKNYMIRFDGTNLTVIEKVKNDKTLIIAGGSNLMSAITSESISNMINQVVIYNSKDELIKTVKNADEIKLYGLMQSYLKQADKKDVTNKAKKLLEDNGVIQKITVNNLGNIANTTGGTVVVKEPYTGMYGLFYIDAYVHTWKRGQYYNKLTLNFKNIMDEKETGSATKNKGPSGTWDYLYKPGGVKNER